MHDRGMWEAFVSFALRDDTIHVAVVPAPSVHIDPTTGEMLQIVLDDTAFTAFMGLGYEKDHVSSVLTDEFDYVFVPVQPEAYVHGIHFLNNLHGKKYNYLDLPLMLIPRSWKKTKKHIEYSESRAPPRIFCSQMGLMLCYTCGVLSPDGNEDPAYCSPKDLYDLIMRYAHGMPCHALQFCIRRNQ